MDTAQSILKARGLSILAMALDGPPDPIITRIVGNIKDTLGIDITDVTILQSLSGDQIDALKTLEKENTQDLLIVVVQRKNTDVPAISKSPAGCINCNLNPSTPTRPNAVFLQNLGGVMVILTFTYIFLITWLPIPEKNQRFVDIILGWLIGSVVTTIVNFFFGSSIKKSDLRKQVADEEVPLPGEEK